MAIKRVRANPRQVANDLQKQVGKQLYYRSPDFTMDNVLCFTRSGHLWWLSQEGPEVLVEELTPSNRVRWAIAMHALEEGYTAELLAHPIDE